MRKKGMWEDSIMRIILILIGGLFVGGIVFFGLKALQNSDKSDIELCRTLMCGSKKAQEASGDLLSVKPSAVCKTHSVEIPQFEGNTNKEGIMREIMELSAKSWHEVCDGPDSNFWDEFGSIFSTNGKECFPTYYFTIKKTFEFDDNDRISPEELEWAFTTTTYKKLMNEDGEAGAYTFRSYIQYFKTPGRIEIMAGLDEFKTNEVYVIAVATPKGMEWAFRDKDNIPRILIAKASELRGKCDGFE